MTFGSLFAGIGGFDLGLERAGMVCKWQVEIDDYATKVLEKHWPHVKRYRDVRAVGKHNLEPVDLICGGFPCQDISNAGKRVGIEGERSGLWAEYARIVREVRPRYVLVENVAALLDRGMGRVLGDLAACGHDAEWILLRARDFGLPHERSRIFIIAHAGGSGLSRLFDEGCSLREPAPAPSTIFGDRIVFGGLPDAPLSSYLRMGNGLSRKRDRIRCLGNAVVPQIAEWIGRRILEADK